MESIHSEYESEYEGAIRELLRSAKRFGKQIELFRGADIGYEIWQNSNAGSDLVTTLGFAEDTNRSLIDALGELGVIKREQLNSQDRKLNTELRALGVTGRTWVADASARENSRVKNVTVAYMVESGITVDQIAAKVETALDRAILNDEKGIVYASDLKFYLEEEGLYGIALQDSRDERFDRLLAEVIAKGRLIIHLRVEAGLPKREPKVKKKKVEK